ncbi:carbohydrate ABC transporter permease [Brachybacterium sp. P6-10-X1]|uniref:carbohydrate ABC transporter permease n=1 Tax=Brachybacterium sp. P6-10-X1 TaxID=1903186 RepID=UPI000976531D|nr:sugar ABC transporter permease [Brachybacterium sp. P6-10-X1]
MTTADSPTSPATISTARSAPGRPGSIPGSPRLAGRRRPSLRGGAAPYAFIAPFYVLYVFFMIIPIGAAIYLSLTEWVGLGVPEFVGVRNYVNLASDSSFATALFNSLIYTLVAVLVVVPCALLIAQALNTKGLRFRDLFRVAFFVPMVLSPIVIALIYSLIFDRDYGLLNASLEALFGLPHVNWLGNPTIAKGAIGFVLLWRTVGYLTIFFLAALQNVPSEQYEAAALDGAGRIRTFFAVTVPGIKPISAFVIVTSFIGAAQLFDEPYLLTKGGPGEATISVAMFIYRAAFERQQFGYAAAAGVVLFAIVFAVSQGLNRLLGIGRDS